jgi:predicted nucleic acid-binding protein
MNYTIDASIFVAAVRDQEVQYQASLEFLDHAQTQGAVILCPSLVLAECAAAIARPTGDVALAEKLVALIENFPGLNLIAVTSSLARRAAQIATSQQLRGADAIYVAVAEASGALLVTWDGEMLTQGAGIVSVSIPQAWLDSQSSIS